jgi:CRP/FNR family transcriptional regulator, cyclic AMP receptor protein
MPVLNEWLPSNTVAPVISGKLKPASAYGALKQFQPVPATTETGPAADPAVRKLIATHPALRALSEPDQQALLRWSRIRHARRKELICRQDDPASAVIFVLEGYVKLSTDRAEGDEVFLDIVGPLECAGELAALQRQPNDANITAMSPCRLLMIEGRPFRQAFDCQPDGLLAIMHLASERILRATERLVDISSLTAQARLAKALLSLTGLSSSDSDGARCLSLRLTQTDLGVITAVCREVVNKQLGIWRHAGWIKMAGGTVTSIDNAALLNILQAESWNAYAGRQVRAA